MSVLPYSPDVDPAPVSRIAFGDEADVDRFITRLEAFERGEMTPTEWKQEQRLNGVYNQKQEDQTMIRVKVPGGIATPRILEAFAVAAERWGHGKGHVTTRQNIQYHFLAEEHVEPLLRYLADEGGLTTREACGHSVRNFTSCVRAGVSADEPFDVTPYTEALAAYFLRQKFAYGLPRKFKPSVGGCCGTDCSQAFINDLGFLARVKDGKRGFRVIAGGGLSTLRRSALTCEEFVPAEEICEAAEAVVRVFNRIGNRTNLNKARLKWAIDKVGTDEFLRQYHEEREKIRADGGRPYQLPAQPVPPVLRPPLPQPVAKRDGFDEWATDSVRPQKQAGFSLVTVRLVLGDLTAAQFRALSSVAQAHGESEVRFTNDQNVVLRYVPTWKLPLVHAELAEAGLAKSGAATIRDVTSCPGASSCAMSVTQSRGLARLLTDTLEARPDLVAQAKDLTIKISGCPNSCGQHHIAGLGFQGGMRKVGGKAVSQYLVHVGGGIDADGARFGRFVTKVPVRRMPEVLEKLIGLYQAERADGETADAFFARVALDRVKDAVGELDELAAADATEADFFDLDEHARNVPLSIVRVDAGTHMC
jgi:sulfite reductase (NADPH) hemoprotein beta-component